MDHIVSDLSTMTHMSWVAARRSYPKSKVRGGGREEQSHIQRVVIVWAQEGLEELSMFKVRRGCGEEIALLKYKGQQLHFAGGVAKRYPVSKVRETQI